MRTDWPDAQPLGSPGRWAAASSNAAPRVASVPDWATTSGGISSGDLLQKCKAEFHALWMKGLGLLLNAPSRRSRYHDSVVLSTFCSRCSTSMAFSGAFAWHGADVHHNGRQHRAGSPKGLFARQGKAPTLQRRIFDPDHGARPRGLMRPLRLTQRERRSVVPPECQGQQQLRPHRHYQWASRFPFAGLSVVQHRFYLCEGLQIDPGSSSNISGSFMNAPEPFRQRSKSPPNSPGLPACSVHL